MAAKIDYKLLLSALAVCVSIGSFGYSVWSRADTRAYTESKTRPHLNIIYRDLDFPALLQSSLSVQNAGASAARIQSVEVNGRLPDGWGPQVDHAGTGELNTGYVIAQGQTVTALEVTLHPDAEFSAREFIHQFEYEICYCDIDQAQCWMSVWSPWDGNRMGEPVEALSCEAEV